MITLIRQLQVHLGLYRMSASALLTYGLGIVDSMTLNVLFTTPIIPLGVLSAALSELQAAISGAVNGNKESKALVRAKRQVVMTMLTAQGGYVQAIANAVENESTAEVIILSAGMKVKKVSVHGKQTFTVKASTMPGAVTVTAAAVKGRSHEWQYTLTPNDATSWIESPPTTQAKTSIGSLTSGVCVFCRHRAVLKTGPTAWDGPLSVIVP